MVNKEKQIEEVLSRGVEKILPSSKGLFDLMKERRIKVYLGIDPTSPDLHLGHAVILRKLRQFQELGHETILLFGTFTAIIGDPSGRDKRRKPLTKAEIERNMSGYLKQAAKIIDFSKTKVEYNHKWMEKMRLSYFNNLASQFTVSRLLERDMFQARLKKGGQVWVNEFLYPLYQGYDSVVLNVDLEIGASDQLFNMMVGRKLQKVYHKKEKYVLTTPMLLGLDGRKMSKTYKNTVNIADSPKQMYGKIMSLRDDLILQYFRLCTDLPEKEVREIERNFKVLRKQNIKELKARLAREIVGIYYGKKAALDAQEEHDRLYKEKGRPRHAPKVELKEPSGNVLLIVTKIVSSKSEAKRLIRQGAVKKWREDHWIVLRDPGEKVETPSYIKIGKKRFFMIVQKT